jgi:hypothetical protein
MGKFLRLSGGVPRSFEESSTPAIYAQRIAVVSGTPANENEIQGPVSSLTEITLPGSQTYIGQELQVSVNGASMTNLYEYIYVGAALDPKTKIKFTFGLFVGDYIDLRIDRAP